MSKILLKNCYYILQSCHRRDLGKMRTALLLQRVGYGAGAVATRDVFKLATINGAKLLNFEKIGKLQECWAADMAIFNINRLEYAGSLSDPLAALIFSGYNHGTQYTIVNGRIAVDNGMLTGVDEQKLTDKANDISQQMIQEA